MRVLFATWAWPSHYFPMVPLAWALRAAGHDVRMASQPELLPTMCASGLPAVVVGRDVDVAGLHRQAVAHLRTQKPSPAQAAPGGEPVPDRTIFAALGRSMRAVRPAGADRDLSLFGAVAGAMVDDLVAFVRGWRPDLVVFDPLTYAAPLAARLAGVPAVRLLFGPDVTYFGADAETRRLRPLLDRYRLGTLDLLGVATVDPCPPSLQYSPAAVPCTRLPMRYVPCSGLSHVPDWACRPAAQPRICLTWGTSTARLVGDDAFIPPALVHACARAARQRGADLMVAITAAQRGLLGEVPDGVTVAESVPLEALLPHCDALVHQGGAGTTLTGLLSGLPQVVVTHLPDQAANAAMLVRAGAGLALTADSATEAAAYAAVRTVLDEPGHRMAATALGEEIKRMPAPAQTVAALCALVRDERIAAPSDDRVRPAGATTAPGSDQATLLDRLSTAGWLAGDHATPHAEPPEP
jgi:UDP:flavonoid glycosyltransferase YjiC (YdhE family)